MPFPLTEWLDMLLKSAITSEPAQSLDMTFPCHFLRVDICTWCQQNECIQLTSLCSKAMYLSAGLPLKTGNNSAVSCRESLSGVLLGSPMETNIIKTIEAQKRTTPKPFQFITIDEDSACLAREQHPK